MKGIKENVVDLLCLLLFPLLGMLYPFFYNSNYGVHSLVTDLDRQIPFIKEFIIPYFLWYPFIYICMAYFCIKDRKVYYRTLISIIIGKFISYGIFYFFQTYVPRPVLQGDDIFTRLVIHLYNTDKPLNCFPSLHVLESYLMMKGISSIQDRNKLICFSINFIAILIIISTQFIKQHVILDAVGAIYLGEIIFNKISSIATAQNVNRKQNLSYTPNP